ncbi:putative transporter svop-1 [Bolinopsis microptera]|uniref:putative transporter svop-1 n=1 Tax=Bolinopsis microptera TaxID=2820187 RepID=UPI0030796A12
MQAGALSSEKEEMLPNYEMLEDIGFGWYQIRHILIVGLIISCDAAQVFILSIIHPSLVCRWQLYPMEVAMMSVVFMLFYMIGSSSGGFLSDIIGRRKTLIFSGIFLVVFELIVPAANGYVAFLLTYGITGMFIGCRYSIGVTYLAEISPIKKRTASVFSVKLFWALGGMFETIVSMIVLEQHGYKYMSFITTVVTIASLILTVLLDESPRWLLANGHFSRALQIIQKAAVQNKSKKKLPSTVTTMEDQMTVTPVSISKERPGVMSVLFHPDYRRMTLAMAFIMFACTALYFSLLYLNTNLHIINYCGVGGNNSHSLHMAKLCEVLDTRDYLDLLVTCIVEIPVLVLAIVFCDYRGRLVAFKVFGGFGSVSLLLLMFCISPVNTEIQLFVSRGIVDGLLLAVWVYVPEIYPTRVRNVAVGLINTAGKLGAVFGILSVQMFSTTHPHLIITIGFVISLLAFATMFTLRKETKDQPLNETAH